MNIVKLPSGTWINLNQVTMARWESREDDRWLSVYYSDGHMFTLRGDDSLAMAKTLDYETEGYRDYSAKAQP